MNKAQIAENFLTFFCDNDFDSLSNILDPNFHIHGPVFEGNKEEYLESLRKDPPQNANVKILCTTMKQGSVRVIYEFSKPGKQIPMVQIFEFNDDKIIKTKLLFDKDLL